MMMAKVRPASKQPMQILMYGKAVGKVLSEMGLRVVRFGNDEVMRDLSAVVRKIKESLARM